MVLPAFAEFVLFVPQGRPHLAWAARTMWKELWRSCLSIPAQFIQYSGVGRHNAYRDCAGAVAYLA